MQLDHIRDVVPLDDLLKPAGHLRRWMARARLTKAQRWIVNEALALRGRNDVAAEVVQRTAKHLRLFGFTGLAIRLLLERGLRDEAAQLLTLEGYPKEAAALYEAEHKWSQAASIHRTLGNIYKAAECYLQADEPDAASTLLQETGDFLAAGRCLERAGFYRKAAELFHEVGRHEEVVGVFVRWKRANPASFDAMGLSEIELMISSLCQTAMDNELLKFLEQRAQLPSLIESLELAGRDEDARILRRARGLEVRAAAEAPKFAMDDTGASLDPAPTSRSLQIQESVATIHLEADENTALLESTMTGSGQLPDDLRELFDRTPFFRQFHQHDRSQLWQAGEILQCKNGDVLVQPGVPPRGVITVLSGTLRLYRESFDGFELAFEVPACRSIGESWGLFEMDAEIKVVASGDCLVHCVDRAKILQKSTHGCADRFAVFLARHLLERVKPEIQPGGHPLFAVET